MKSNQDMMEAQEVNNTNGNMGVSNMGSVSEMPNMMASGISGNEKPAKEKKSSKGMLIGMILLAVVAVGGIGFGVWAMMDGNVQKDNYEEQISTLRTQNNELLEKNSDLTRELDAATTNNADDVANVEISDSIDTTDYIYVGEWGIKIKKPENWKNIVREYRFYNGYPQAADTLEIRESPNSGDGIMVSTSKTSCEAWAAARYGTCFMVDDVAVLVNKMDGELAPGLESVISETFLNHFYNPDNYSKI